MTISRHPDDGFRFADPWPMSRAMVSRFHGLIRAFIPSAPVVPDVERRIESQVRRMMRYMQPFVATGFLATLVILDWAPVWMGRRLQRLQDMPAAAASALLSDIQHGLVAPVSDLVVAARAAILAPYYDLEEVGRHIGWDPAPFMDQRVALRAKLLAGAKSDALDEAPIGPFSDTARGVHTQPVPVRTRKGA